MDIILNIVTAYIYIYTHIQPAVEMEEHTKKKLKEKKKKKGEKKIKLLCNATPGAHTEYQATALTRYANPP